MRRKFIVGLLEAIAPDTGQSKDLRRATAAPLAIDALLTRLDDTFADQGLEVPSDGCWSQPQSRAEITRGQWPVLQDRPRDSIASASVQVRLSGVGCPTRRRIARCFHNAIVLLFRAVFK